MRERTLELQGRRPQQRVELEALQHLADALDDDRRRAELATRRSMLAVRTGDFRTQEAAARLAMSLAGRAHDHELRLNAQRLVADALARQGDAAAARTLAQDGLAEARVRGLRGVEGRFLNALTVVAARQQDIVAMLEASQAATDLRRALGDRRNEAIGLSTLGAGWLELGDFAQARRHLEDALRLHGAVGDRAMQPIVLANLSQLALWEGDPAQALLQAQAALEIAEAVQATDLQALALWCVGNAELAARRHVQADAAFERAHAVSKSLDSALQHDAVAGRSRVALARGDLAGALASIQALRAHLAGGGTLEGTLGTGLIQLTCCQVLARTGDPEAAAMLERVHVDLQTRAAAISDESVRRGFLSQVPENREIVAAWMARQQTRPEVAA